MSDFRNPNDPLWRDTSYDSGTPSYGSAGAWIAGAAVVVVVLLIAFGVRHEPSQIASNDIAPPAATRMAPPPATVPHPANPALGPGLVPTPAPQGTNNPQ
jgi:hypothetical protein